MIFVTVGNMDPFDRLIKAIDEWIASSETKVPVFAQIGTGTYRPKNCEFVPFLTPAEYRKKFQESQFVVSHAGMGTIITSLELMKTIVIMPKRASLGEQRNEHQLATVKHFKRSQNILVADTEADLPGVLNDVLKSFEANPGEKREAAAWPANESLINFVREFVS